MLRPTSQVRRQIGRFQQVCGREGDRGQRAPPPLVLLRRWRYNIENCFFLLQSEAAQTYPPKTFIVDLMHEPGTLLPAESAEADSYKRL